MLLAPLIGSGTVVWLLICVRWWPSRAVRCWLCLAPA